jgi:hypothetical protein
LVLLFIQKLGHRDDQKKMTGIVKLRCFSKTAWGKYSSQGVQNIPGACRENCRRNGAIGEAPSTTRKDVWGESEHLELPNNASLVDVLILCGVRFSDGRPGCETYAQPYQHSGTADMAQSRRNADAE